MTIQNLSSNFLSAVDTKSFMEYGTKIQKAQDSKENTEESIFKLQNVSYTSQNTSSSKSEDLTKDNNKVSTPDTSKTLSLLQSLVQSLTSLINQLTGKQEDLYDDNLEAVKPNKTEESDDADLNTASKANDNNQKTQTDEEKSLKVESKSELLKKIEEDNLDSTLLRPEDLEEIFAYDVQYIDGKIICTDVNGKIRKEVHIGKGQFTYDRVGDSNQMRCNGRVSHSFGYGQYYESKMMPKDWFIDDLTYYYTYITDHYKDVLREQGFEFNE